MKKATFLLITLFPLMFVGCNKDDDPKPLNADVSLIPGVWDLVEFRIDNGTISTELLGQAINATFTAVGKNYDASVTFTENPMEVISTGTYDVVTTTTVLGQTDTEETPLEELDFEGVWDVMVDQLTISSASQILDAEVATITELTNETMRLKIDINETDEEFGIKTTTIGTVIYMLKKK